jgi:Na+/H+ antiporter NhaC
MMTVHIDSIAEPLNQRKNHNKTRNNKMEVVLNFYKYFNLFISFIVFLTAFGFMAPKIMENEKIKRYSQIVKIVSVIILIICLCQVAILFQS